MQRKKSTTRGNLRFFISPLAVEHTPTILEMLDELHVVMDTALTELIEGENGIESCLQELRFVRMFGNMTAVDFEKFAKMVFDLKGNKMQIPRNIDDPRYHGAEILLSERQILTYLDRFFGDPPERAVLSMSAFFDYLIKVLPQSISPSSEKPLRPH